MTDIYDENDKTKIDQESGQNIADLIKALVEKMGVQANVEIEDSFRGKIFNISSPDSNLLIGQHGANLQALQTIVGSIVSKKYALHERFMIDVDDYRRKREWYLRETAKKAIELVKKSHKPVTLEPMPPYERRVIHAFLSEDFNVETESIGREPNRRIVVKPKSKFV